MNDAAPAGRGGQGEVQPSGGQALVQLRRLQGRATLAQGRRDAVAQAVDQGALDATGVSRA
jgi:hypothetical protein